jgi:hypothetical protein
MVVTAHASRARQAETSRQRASDARASTGTALRDAAEEIHARLKSPGFLERMANDEGLWVGRRGALSRVGVAYRPGPQEGQPWLILDGWEHPVLFRCPGPVHKHGWDVWSCGPNGIDEHGGGDDILVGEDVPDEGSGR